jgi:MoxR-like ATPase
VELEHLQVLTSILWEDPTGQPEKVMQIVLKVANPAGMKANSLLIEAEQICENADLKQLAQAAVAASKLSEIEKRLHALGNHPKAAMARKHVREQIKKIKLASIEAL